MLDGPHLCWLPGAGRSSWTGALLPFLRRFHRKSPPHLFQLHVHGGAVVG